MRHSILGAIITNTILIIGSILVIINAIKRIINPIVINYDGMLLLSIFGIIVNILAFYFTKDSHSHNEKSINLHMLEDVFSWIIVLIGAIVIKYTNLFMIDSILSIFLGLFILYHTINNYKEIIDIFLEKIPNNINVDEIKKDILKINNVLDIHHIHIWTIDGINNYLTMHVVTDSKDVNKLKKEIKDKLKEKNISHVTLEIEDEMDKCSDYNCHTDSETHIHKHHH